MQKLIIIFLYIGLGSIAMGQVTFYNDVIRLPLKENHGFFNDGLDYIETGNGQYIYLHNSNNSEIIKYELVNNVGSIHRIINYQREGANGFGKSTIEGLTVFNENKLGFYSYWEKTLYIFNENGIILQKYIIEDQDESAPVLTTSGVQKIIELYNNQYFLAGHLYKTFSKEILKSPIVNINIKEQNHRYVARHTPTTYEGSWVHKHITCFDRYMNGSIIISYSISDSIHIYNPKLESTTSKLAKSRFIKNIKPISVDYNFDAGVNKERFNNYSLMNQYFGVKFDKYRNLIYRFAIKERTIDELKRGEDVSFILIILNNEFESLGEYELPLGYYPQFSFINNDGLFILNKYYYDNVSDDYLSFSQIEICE